MQDILHNKKYSDKILQMTADTMCMLDYEGNLIDIVVHGTKWLLGKDEELIGKNIFDLLPKKTISPFKKEFNKVIEYKLTSTKNYELSSNDTTYYAKCIMYPFEEGLILLQYRDITNRARIKLKLERTNKELQEIEHVAKIGQWSFNPKTQRLKYKGFTGAMCNSTFNKHIHFSDCISLIHHDDRERFMIWFNENLENIKQDTIEYRIIWNGKVIFIRLKIISDSRKNQNDTIEGYCQNITDIIKLDDNLVNITKAINYASEDIFAIKSDGTLTFANEQFCKHHMLPYKPNLSAININDLPINDSLKLRWKSLFGKFNNLTDIIKYVEEKPFPHIKSILAFDYFSYLVKGSDGESTIWTFGRDISEQMIYEAQIKELNQIMTTILENIPIAISVKDSGDDFKYIYRNSIYYDKKEKVANSILGKTDFDLFPKNIAKMYREEDVSILNNNKRISYTTESIDEKGKKHIINKLKLLVENGKNPPLIIALRWDVTDMKMMEKELIKAKEKAEISDKLKSAFLANMSHEIRTPLNAIVGFSRVIADTNDPEERLGYYNIVEANNSRLLQLINEILDLSRIESGMMEFSEAPINLNSMCMEIHDTHEFRFSSNVKLYFDKSDPNLWINSDKNRLIQVFSNLIGNAIKFTQNGYIRFGYKKNKNEIEFYVSDTGGGISPDKIEKIFERFTKLDNFAQGTGLGLSICKSIVERLGGKISVQSKLGEGTIFTFTHPHIDIDDKDADSNSEQEIEETTKTDFTTPSGQVILVAEDNESNFKLLNVMIGKSFTLIHAHDGIEAITMFEQYNPELILMDIKMPNMNGLDAVRIIREVSQNVPIIALSAYAYEEDRRAALDCGCNEFIAKPISQTILLQTLKKYL